MQIGGTPPADVLRTFDVELVTKYAERRASRMPLSTHTLVLAGLCVAACAGSRSDRAASVDAGQLADASRDGGTPGLPGVTFDFEVDRECSRSSGLPGAPIPESDYSPVAPEPRYRVVFSADGATVSIRPLLADGAAWIGERSSSDGNLYELDAFAGGRFAVLPGVTPPGAELVIYGSGVPVVSCEKGTLRGR